MPLHAHRRLRTEFDSWAKGISDVEFRHVPSTHEEISRIASGDLSQVRSNVQSGFVHIAALPSRDSRRLIDAFRFDCRVISLATTGDLERLSWNEFRAALEVALSFERRWLSVVQPRDLNHPLLLPPRSFIPARRLGDYWRRCDCYRDTARLDEANTVLQGVHKEHQRSSHDGRVWMDADSRMFRIDKSLHARTPEERRGERKYRFCYAVTAGFHYDVTHAHAREFYLTAFDGERYRVTRANVTPWDHVRPAIL